MDDNYPPAKPDELRAWLALIRIAGLGSRTISRLLAQYPDASTILTAAAARHPGFTDECLQRRLASPPWDKADADLAWLQQPSRHLIHLGHPHYPESLKLIDDPPVALFAIGDPEWLCQPQLAIVGSRNPTPTGRSNAREFARTLGQAGITITSGLAAGVDAAAHQGALLAKAKTVAVAATGLNQVYPQQHHELAAEIAAQGVLVSEFPPGTPPRRGHFPRRNRIISGLSLGTLVVEAARRSGSLITARCAVEQGREVFALPGSIHNPLAKGCHHLIRQGATLVESAQDILEQLGPLFARLQVPQQHCIKADQPQLWDDEYRRLLNALEPDPQPNDLLIARSGLTADAVSSMLLLLELEGYVSSAPGRGYCLTRKTLPDAAD